MIDDLTKPERACERGIAKRKLAEVYRRGGCLFCVNRAGSAWGIGYCTVASRSFPLCLHDGLTPSFQLDETKMKRAA